MSTRQIHVFISHSWTYSGHYDTLARWIFEMPWRSGQASLDLRNFSVPKSDPILDAGNDAQLKAAIDVQMGRSHVIVIPTGMYANYSKWIRKEILSAADYQKPILAVNPWGAVRTSSVVSGAATKTVGWNSNSVVSAIWDLFRTRN